MSRLNHKHSGSGNFPMRLRTKGESVAGKIVAERDEPMTFQGKPQLSRSGETRWASILTIEQADGTTKDVEIVDWQSGDVFDAVEESGIEIAVGVWVSIVVVKSAVPRERAAVLSCRLSRTPFKVEAEDVV